MIADTNSVFVTTSMGGEAYAQWVRRAISHLASAGTDIVPLFGSSVGEPVELLRELAERAFSAPITHKYQSAFVNGNPYLIDALAERYSVAPERILATTGATSGLSLVYRAFLKPGDHVLVETPGFDLFGDIGRLLGAKVDYFRRSGANFAIDESELASKVNARTKLVVLSNLHNPSGAMLSADVVCRLARVAASHGAHLFVDEVYGDYARTSMPAASAAQLAPNVIAVNSLTKIYGLSTLRCGWVIASPENLAPIRHLSDRFEFGVSKLTHALAALVLDERHRFDAYSEAVLRAARPIMNRHFSEWQQASLVTGKMPRFGCICFLGLAGIHNTLAFSDWLANRYGVIVAPGEFFGAPGHVRLGYALAPDELVKGLTRFSEGLREYLSKHSDAEYVVD